MKLQQIRSARLVASTFMTLIWVLSTLTPAQAQTRGPGRGGGGEIRASQPATESDVVIGLFNGVRLLKYALHMFERNYFETSKVNAADRKRIYANPEQIEMIHFMMAKRGGQNAIDALLELDYDVRAKGDCLDPDNKTRKASSWDPVSRKVCVSLEKILEVAPGKNRLTVDEAEKKMIILLGHELSHRMDANEAQAKIFEDLVAEKVGRANTGSTMMEQIHVSNELHETYSRSLAAVELVRDASEPMGEVCRDIDPLVRTAYTWTSGDFQSPYQPRSNSTQGRLMGLAVRMQILSAYCLNPKRKKSPVPIFKVDEYFRDESQVTLNQIVGRRWTMLREEMVPPQTIYPRPYYADRAGLQSELIVIATEARAIIELLRNEESEIQKARRVLNEPMKRHVRTNMYW